jgi:hypothetical protein
MTNWKLLGPFELLETGCPDSEVLFVQLDPLRYYKCLINIKFDDFDLQLINMLQVV